MLNIQTNGTSARKKDCDFKVFKNEDDVIGVIAPGRVRVISYGSGNRSFSNDIETSLEVLGINIELDKVDAVGNCKPYHPCKYYRQYSHRQYFDISSFSKFVVNGSNGCPKDYIG